MVTVDDATYVKMKDTLYGGDASKASRAKGQIESKYTDEQYSNFLTQLDSYTPKQSTPSTPAAPENTGTNDTPVTPPPANADAGSPTAEQGPTVKTGTEVKQEGALKPETQEYYNQTSDEALKVIKDNLESYRQTNPEFFKDYESFKKNFSYNARNDAQKNVLDTWYNGYQEGLSLAGTPTTDLYTQYQNGDLSAAQLESLRIYNPTKYAELQNQINRGNIIAAYDDDKGGTGTTLSLQDMAYQMAANIFSQFMSGNSDSGASKYFAEYEEKMQSPEMLGILDKTTELEEKKENIEDDIATIQKAVEKEYEGTGASRSKINAIIADRTYDLQLQLRTINSEYNKYATQYNNRLQQYQNEFNLQLQEYQINQQERQQQLQELGFALDLMSFETPEQQAEREREYRVRQQEYSNGNINSKDYNTRYKAALTSVQNLLTEYSGIPMSKSAEQMADEILKAIDNGSTLGQELTKIHKQMQATPEYKKLYNATYGTSNPVIEDSFTNGNVTWVKYKGQWMTADDFNQMFGGNNAAKDYTMVNEAAFTNSPMSVKGYDGKTLYDFMSKASSQKGYTAGQCGKFVNDYLQSIGVTGASNRYYDNDLSTKLNSINSHDVKAGTIAVFDYGYKSKTDGINHGHVGIVTKVYADGSFDILDSNRRSDEKVDVRHVTEGDKDWNALQGFFDPSKEPKSKASTADQGYVSARIGLYDKYLNSGQKPTDAMLKGRGNGDIAKGTAMFEAEVEAYKQAQGYTEQFSPEAEAELTALRKEFNGLETVKTYNSMRTYYDKLIRANNGTAAGDMAMVFNFMKMLDPNSVVREGEYANAAKTAGLGTRLVTLCKKVDKGEILAPSQRTEFINIAKEYLQGAADLYNSDLQKYQTYVTKGGDPKKVGDMAVIEDYSSTYETTDNSKGKERQIYTPNWSWLSDVPSVYTRDRSTTNVGGHNLPTDFYDNN